jgi:hypothetical protein
MPRSWPAPVTASFAYRGHRQSASFGNGSCAGGVGPSSETGSIALNEITQRRGGGEAVMIQPLPYRR